PRPDLYPLSLHDALPIYARPAVVGGPGSQQWHHVRMLEGGRNLDLPLEPVRMHAGGRLRRQDLDDDPSPQPQLFGQEDTAHPAADRKSTRLNSSHVKISY